jgi:hypothetical protein
VVLHKWSASTDGGFGADVVDDCGFETGVPKPVGEEFGIALGWE